MFFPLLRISFENGLFSSFYEIFLIIIENIKNIFEFFRFSIVYNIFIENKLRKILYRQYFISKNNLKTVIKFSNKPN